MTGQHETTAYQPGKRTWRHDVEHWLDQLDAFYCALWDLMPAIAAGLFLTALLIANPR